MQVTGNTILITGAGSGIGRALALRLNDLGNTVVVAGRRQAALDETIAGRDDMYAVPLDLEIRLTLPLLLSASWTTIHR